MNLDIGPAAREIGSTRTPEIPPSKIDYSHIGTARRLSVSFDAIYDVYKQGFPHGARSPDFFRHMMTLNESASVQREHGPIRYQISYAGNRDRVLGTAMYTMMAAPEGGWPNTPYNGAVGIDYRSVLPDARGSGIAGAFEQHARSEAARFLVDAGRLRNPQDARLVVFNESSMPLRMPLGDYVADVRIVKLDPIDRVRIWNKSGFRRFLPAPGVPLYAEPASIDKEPACLYYSANVKSLDPLGAQMVGDIFLRYAAFRRMDGQDPRADRDFDRMMGQLARVETLRPIHDTPLLGFIQPRARNYVAQLPEEVPELLVHQPMGRLLRGSRGASRAP